MARSWVVAGMAAGRLGSEAADDVYRPAIAGRPESRLRYRPAASNVVVDSGSPIPRRPPRFLKRTAVIS